MPEPAILKMLKSAMVCLLTARDGGGELAEAVLEEGERRLVAHRVLRELALLHLGIDRIAVERGGERHAVLQELLGGDAAVGGRGGGDITRIRGRRPQRIAR